MAKHIIEKAAPINYRVPENIPPTPKFHSLSVDPPWSRSQTGAYGAVKHYDLMSLERIKAMPVSDLAAEDAALWLWSTNGNIEDALEVIKTWGFTYRTYFVWAKPSLGLGQTLRNCTEICLLATRGKIKPKVHNQMNFGYMPNGKHSEKPREMTSVFERMYPGPYLELFCRRRPASAEKWYCWGNETEGGADLYIPGYPVPKYSWEQDGSHDTKEEV